MLFNDRRHAGILLAKELESYRGTADTLVLALPRGGAVVGLELSLELHLPLDVFITRKIGLPEQPEYAIGAVSETGSLYVNPDATAYLSLSRDDLDGLIAAQRHEITRRQELYRQGRPFPSLHNKAVIVVDDGIATGSTFFATIEALANLSPRHVVAAIPVSPVSTAAKVRAVVDHCVILDTPEPFFAVGEFYADFQQVDDAEVVRCLAQADQTYRERSHLVRSGRSSIRPH
jgi:putative phosphoribosyl transferase